MTKLSERLRRIAELVPAGGTLADIGTDHALLPVYLAENGRIRRAVAVDVNAGPLEAARRQVAAAGLGERIDVRLGDGLGPLAPGEADTIVIAGMGGALMRDILEAGRPKLAGVRRLVLQPNVGAELVREWLLVNAWLLVDEDILEEDGIIYEILVAEPAASREQAERPYAEERIVPGRAGRSAGIGPASEAFTGGQSEDIPAESGAIVADRDAAGRANTGAVDAAPEADARPPAAGVVADRKLKLKMGPHLLRRGGPTFAAKWRQELDKLEAIRSRLAESDQPAAKEKDREFAEWATRIREVLACLRTERT